MPDKRLPMPTRGELLAYLDEQLPAARSAEIEAALRDDEDLRRRAARLLSERDAGTHSVADICRRQRVFCPGIERLGEHLLGTLEPAWAEAVELHVNAVGCRMCDADLAELRGARTESAAAREGRTRRLFESTVGVRP